MRVHADFEVAAKTRRSVLLQDDHQRLSSVLCDVHCCEYSLLHKTLLLGFHFRTISVRDGFHLVDSKFRIGLKVEIRLVPSDEPGGCYKDVREFVKLAVQTCIDVDQAYLQGVISFNPRPAKQSGCKLINYNNQWQLLTNAVVFHVDDTLPKRGNRSTSICV